MRMRTLVASAALATAAVFGGAGAAAAHDGPTAIGVVSGSPGLLSGNVIQMPVYMPFTFCGNSFTVIGFFNPAMGVYCVA
ncbi:chaplin [Streptomyces sp. NPDC127084]|uniref:chaplin n=1 Tax=Streptomyces sp. NPDC127084 TaxID=3347133 RepID=UPI003646C2FB